MTNYLEINLFNPIDKESKKSLVAVIYIDRNSNMIIFIDFYSRADLYFLCITRLTNN